MYGAIITWPGDPGRQGTVAHGAAQRSVLDRLAADWTGLRTSFRELPLCVAGDFNVSLAGPVYPSQDLRRHLGAALGQANVRCLTEGLAAPDGKPLVDHICLGGLAGARVVAGDCIAPPPNPRSAISAPVSDHPLVWVSISW